MRGLRGFGAACVVLCLTSLVLACGRRPSTAVEPTAVTVTNVVEVVRTVVQTNVVEMTCEVVVTNVVVEKREPERILSARRTAPYRVFAEKLDAVTLRKMLSDAGARTIACEGGAVALVEASDKTVKSLRRVVGIEALSVEGKISSDAGENVKVIPLSTIDAAAITAAIRALGGEIAQVVTVGQPAVRAKVPFAAIRKLAERGDVRRIERDDRK